MCLTLGIHPAEKNLHNIPGPQEMEPQNLQPKQGTWLNSSYSVLSTRYKHHNQGRQPHLLSLSLDDSRITRDKCLGRTQWSSPLDLATYLYYFTSGCVPIITWSHDLPEHSMITWPCHMIWLPNLPCYLYLDPIIRLDVRDQMFECMGNSFLSGALITSPL